jgi:hypothetical protein
LALGESNILSNGNLTEGSGNIPNHWHSESLGRASTFSWIHNPGEPGELRITSTRPGFARWSQAVHLDPGGYLITGETLNDDADRQTAGAMIGVHVDGRTFGLPQTANNSSNWTTGAIYLKVGDFGSDAEIVCQLEGSSGTASFRNLRLTRTAEPPPEVMTVDLDSIFRERAQREKRAIPKSFEKPTGTPWTFPATMVLFAAVALSGWLVLGRTKERMPTETQER